MNVRQLRQFYADQIAQAKADDVLLSLHVKTTMMRISDPIIFGHCVSVYYEDVFKQALGMRWPRLGLTRTTAWRRSSPRFRDLPEDKRKEIEADIQAVYEKQPELYMVNSNRGITNLHVPSDTIIDASMPVIIRDGGRAWGPDNELHDCIAMIPDRSYSTTVPGGYRGLPGERGVRPISHRERGQRRPDGPGRRRVWFPRQDLQGSRQRRDTGGGRSRSRH